MDDKAVQQHHARILHGHQLKKQHPSPCIKMERQSPRMWFLQGHKVWLLASFLPGNGVTDVIFIM